MLKWLSKPNPYKHFTVYLAMDVKGYELTPEEAVDHVAHNLAKANPDDIRKHAAIEDKTKPRLWPFSKN